MRLFCFHCAGGSSSMFKHWKLEGVEVISFNLPGRGNQVNLPLVDDFDEAVKCLVTQVEERIQDSRVWGVFGHSMGALLAYEVTRRLGNRTPMFRILSGVNPLQEYRGLVRVTKDDDMTLMKKMGKLGGIPNNLQKNSVFVKWFIPVFRADLSLVESFVFRKDYSSTQTYIINGSDDVIINKDNFDLWKEYLNHIVSIETIKGGHFEILKQPGIIQNLMLKYSQVGINND